MHKCSKIFPIYRDDHRKFSQSECRLLLFYNFSCPLPTFHYLQFFNVTLYLFCTQLTGCINANRHDSVVYIRLLLTTTIMRIRAAVKIPARGSVPKRALSPQDFSTLTHNSARSRALFLYAVMPKNAYPRASTSNERTNAFECPSPHWCTFGRCAFCSLTGTQAPARGCESGVWKSW